MNRKRCPWCGKRIDKNKDTILWRDVIASPSVPRMLRKANCGHCGRKYGQVPVFQHVLRIVFIVIFALVLAFALQSGILFVLAFTTFFWLAFTPYSKLDDQGKTCEANTDLMCKMMIIEKYNKINRYELYFLNDCFDDFDPFILASPIHIYDASKKSNIVLGEFLYMHQKNHDYIQKDSCELYDTEMNLIAKIKFITDVDTVS